MRLPLSLKKSMSWFTIAFIIQFVLVIYLTGGLLAAITAGLTVATGKSILFFVHEWGWGKLLERKVPASQCPNSPNAEPEQIGSD